MIVMDDSINRAMNATNQQLAAAWRLHEQGQVAAAEEIYRRVLLLNPESANAWCCLGIALHDRRRFPEAVEAYKRASALNTQFPLALTNMASSLLSLGRSREAEASCRRAIQLRPESSQSHNNLGAALLAQGRYDEAMESFENVLKIDPLYAPAHSNKGVALVRLGQVAAARACHEEAVRVDPEYVDAHRNKAILDLLMGDFQRGWPAYEWRLRGGDCRITDTGKPRWEGQDLSGRTIVVLAEQGLGDTLQFIRYAPLLKQRGAKVVAVVQKPLLQILAGCPGVDMLTTADAIPDDHDFQTPLLSLPGVFKTELESIPGQTPYLRTDSALVEKWRSRLGSGDRLRVGIAWQGNPKHPYDRQRSAPLEFLRPLGQLLDVELICLQKGYGAEQIESLSPPFPITQLDGQGDREVDEGGAFTDTAAIMQNLDLVVTTDTVITHLAGALNIETWVALGKTPDWRWMLDRPDSPWYPSLRLFRQSERGASAWANVFERMATELKDLAMRTACSANKQESAPRLAIKELPPPGLGQGDPYTSSDQRSDSECSDH